MKKYIIVFLMLSLLLIGCDNKSNNSQPKPTTASIPSAKDGEVIDTVIEYHSSNNGDDIKLILKRINDIANIDYTCTPTEEHSYSDYLHVESEIDEDIYNRILTAWTYADSNEEEFNKKALQVSHDNIRDELKTKEDLFYWLFMWTALSIEEPTDLTRTELNNSLIDIESIINHELIEDDQYLICECRDEYYNEDDSKPRVVDYDTYVDTWNFYKNNQPLPFTDTNKDYVIYMYLCTNGISTLQLENMTINHNIIFADTIDLVIYERSRGDILNGDSKLLIIPVDKGTTLGCVDYSEPLELPFNDMINTMCDKPVIYLYPESKSNIDVYLTANNMTTIWPKADINDNVYHWNVESNPDGTIYKDNYEYSYIFWEAKTNSDYTFTKGFCVKGEDTGEFLRDTLSQIGLTPKEYNEFIVYWLPQMQDNKYNLISFEGLDPNDNYNKEFPLYIEDENGNNPDSTLRVNMYWTPSDYIEIEPQTFTTFERNGFTVVEWGGQRVK